MGESQGWENSLLMPHGRGQLLNERRKRNLNGHVDIRKRSELFIGIREEGLGLRTQGKPVFLSRSWLRQLNPVSQVCVPRLEMLRKGIRPTAPVRIEARADLGIREDKLCQQEILTFNLLDVKPVPLSHTLHLPVSHLSH